jgi:phosphatidylglycerophosphatase C
MALVLIASPVLLLLLLLKASRWMPVRFAVWISTLGVTREQLPQLVQAFLRSQLAGTGSLVLQDGLDRVAMHKDAGHQVIIATGALELLARAICDSVGLDGAVIVGSSLRPFLGGLVADQHCHGARKILMLTERGYPPDWEFVYTDHHADLPILSHAHQRFLVNPRPSTVARVRSALGTASTILSWK